MSGTNGDKARFHKQRKKKIAQRDRNRKMIGHGAEPQKAAPVATSKPKAVIA